jgi:hypothetical protein
MPLRRAFGVPSADACDYGDGQGGKDDSIEMGGMRKRKKKTKRGRIIIKEKEKRAKNE